MLKAIHVCHNILHKTYIQIWYSMTKRKSKVLQVLVIDYHSSASRLHHWTKVNTLKSILENLISSTQGLTMKLQIWNSHLQQTCTSIPPNYFLFFANLLDDHHDWAYSSDISRFFRLCLLYEFELEDRCIFPFCLKIDNSMTGYPWKSIHSQRNDVCSILQSNCLWVSKYFQI